jgi:hypothetical protein
MCIFVREKRDRLLTNMMDHKNWIETGMRYDPVLPML